MYRVWGKRGLILSVVVLALVVFFMVGFAGKVMHASAAPRQLPIYSVETDKKEVALGINCAWDDKDIDAILKTLEEKNVKATFFLVGSWCRQYPAAVKKLAEAGQELGSHSNTHPDMTKLSREEIQEQLDRSKELIKEYSGQEATLFRAPSGAYNNLVVETARATGWEVIQWDCDTLDWKKCDADAIIRNGTKNLQNGSILLLHAGAAHTAEALPGLIEKIQEEGYQMIPVGELIYPQPYEIDHTGRQKTK